MGKHSHKKRNKNKKNGKHYRLFFGIPHAHSSYSTGKGSPSDAYKYAKNKKLDYLILTDHAPFLKHNIEVKDKKLTKWEFQKLYSKSMDEKYKYFAALCGFECKIRSIGDVNIYNSQGLPSQHFKGTKQFIDWLREDNDRVVCINHPHESVNRLLKYPELNEFITLMEVGNGSYPNKYLRYYNRFFHFLDNGWKLGAVIGQDNHRENWGDNENLTAILAEKINSRAVIEAYRNRRTYATESKSLMASLKINNAIMGEILPLSTNEILNFSILAEDRRYAITKVQVISNNRVIIKEENFDNLNKISLVFSHETTTEQTWYCAVIYQVDNKQALLSPIFIEKK